MRHLKYLVFCLLLVACSQAKETVWVYSTIFPETLQIFTDELAKKYPDLEVKWFQGGGEKINAKLALEQKSGKIQADLVVATDIFWFKKMAENAFFEPYSKEFDFEIDPVFKDEQNRFIAPRISMMVLGYNKKFISEADAPKSFRDLSDPKFKNKVSLGSPLDSGTMLNLVSQWIHQYSYTFIHDLKANNVISAGGNSAVMQRLVSGERPVAVILLESLLNEQTRNPDIGIIYPADGAVVIPGPMAILKSSKHKEAAKKIYDFIMSTEGQRISVKANVHVLDPSVGNPLQAKTLTELRESKFKLSDEFYAFIQNEGESLKQKYADIMFK